MSICYIVCKHKLKVNLTQCILDYPLQCKPKILITHQKELVLDNSHSLNNKGEIELSKLDT